jgi:hypothetical protein
VLNLHRANHEVRAGQHFFAVCVCLNFNRVLDVFCDALGQTLIDVEVFFVDVYEPKCTTVQLGVVNDVA